MLCSAWSSVASDEQHAGQSSSHDMLPAAPTAAAQIQLIARSGAPFSGTGASMGLLCVQAAQAGRRRQQGAGHVVVVRAEKRTVVIGLAADSGKLVTSSSFSLGPTDGALCASDLCQPGATCGRLAHPLCVS